MSNIPALRRFIRHHEGMNQKVYLDSEGISTIGIGRNLSGKGLSMKEVFYLFNNDTAEAMQAAHTYPWFAELSEARQAAVVSLIFQLGELGFSKFKLTIAALEAGQYEIAAQELLDSRFARQTPHRAMETAEIIRNGVYPPWLQTELSAAKLS